MAQYHQRAFTSSFINYVYKDMYKIVLTLIFITFKVVSQCSHQPTTSSGGKSAICILHEDNLSGVKGRVTIHQEN